MDSPSRPDDASTPPDADHNPDEIVGESVRPLFFHGAITLEHDGHTLILTGTGREVVLDVPGIRALRALAGSVPRRGGGVVWPDLAGALRHHDLDVVLRLRGETIATIGPDAKPGAIERVLSMQDIDVDVRGLIRGIFKRRV